MSKLLLFAALIAAYLPQQPKKKTFTLAPGVKINMIWVAPGSFLMGSPEDEAGRNIVREKQHDVIITKGFWLAETEFTQGDWGKIMGANPSSNKGKNHPVETISYHDIEELIRRINKNGENFRLPTEAEWEYACRAGTTGPYPGDIEKTVWHIGNSGRASHQVATKDPNPWGFYDMQGNILEWCSDWLQEDNTSEKLDPKGPNIGEYKVQRGGQFTGRIRHTRAADRQRDLPESREFYVGFRLAKNEID